MDNGAGSSQAVRDRCVELLLALAVSSSSLSFFLSTLNLLLFPVAPVKSLGVLDLLHKLENMRRVGTLPLLSVIVLSPS